MCVEGGGGSQGGEIGRPERERESEKERERKRGREGGEKEGEGVAGRQINSPKLKTD